MAPATRTGSYEALSVRRVYHEPRGHREIMEILDGESGRKNDPWLLAQGRRVLASADIRAICGHPA